jgi:3-phosphoshikimate 1-carboxyvinyltransferase
MLAISSSRLSGNIAPPPSKSQSLRALLFAALAFGESFIENLLNSPDVLSMKNGCSAFGATFEGDNPVRVKGIGGVFRTPDQVIDAGNSGITLRFLMGIAPFCEGFSLFTGDSSIRSQRSVKQVLQGLEQLGVTAFSTRNNGLAPVVIKGPLLGGKVKIDGEDSQPVSALLIALSMAPQPSILEVMNPGEKPWVDLTIDWLKKMGVLVKREGYHRFFLEGGAKFQGFHYKVPADLSSFSFPLVAAIVTDSVLTLEGLDLEDPQGDKKILSILKEMGAHFEVKEGLVKVLGKGDLKGIEVDMNDCIDALPILSVLATFAKGRTRLFGASVARGKECDRIAAICSELRKMGALIIEESDGVTIYGGELKGAFVSSHKDHRIAMSLAVGGLGAQGVTTIDEICCIDKTYPDFVKAFQKIGAQMEWRA